jgi:hypothetical protein
MIGKYKGKSGHSKALALEEKANPGMNISGEFDPGQTKDLIGWFTLKNLKSLTWWKIDFLRLTFIFALRYRIY